MKYEIKTLSDLSIDGKGHYGIAAPAVEYSESLPTYLRITDINDNGTIDYSGLKSVSDDNASDYFLKANDIVFARTGASTGRNYFYDGTGGKFVYAGFLIKFSIDEKKVNPKYVKYYCMSQLYRDWVSSFSTGSTRGNINAQTYGNMPILLPSRPQQDFLVQILSALDDKIELNNQINKNLEEQAQALYNSWFVDFEPFGGVMPADWAQADIYSLAEVIYGAPFASKYFNNTGDGIPIIRIRDLKEQKFITYTTEKHSKGYLLQKGDIVVGMDGEFRPYIWGNSQAWLNQRVCVFKNKRPNGKAFLYYTIKPLLLAIEQTQVATTVIHIGKKDFDLFKVALPANEILDKFDNITTPIIDQIVQNTFENKILCDIRETLLPKLMSGEIDVDNVEGL